MVGGEEVEGEVEEVVVLVLVIVIDLVEGCRGAGRGVRLAVAVGGEMAVVVVGDWAPGGTVVAVVVDGETGVVLVVVVMVRRRVGMGGLRRRRRSWTPRWRIILPAVAGMRGLRLLLLLLPRGLPTVLFRKMTISI
jgi:hypothetical protein